MAVYKFTEKEEGKTKQIKVVSDKGRLYINFSEIEIKLEDGYSLTTHTLYQDANFSFRYKDRKDEKTARKLADVLSVMDDKDLYSHDYKDNQKNAELARDILSRIN